MNGAATEWERAHGATLDSPSLERGLELLPLSTGKGDFVLPRTSATVQLVRNHGFTPVYKETPGGHTWINWRNYLQELVPQLFR